MRKSQQTKKSSLPKVMIAGGILVAIVVLMPNDSAPVKKAGKGFQFAGAGGSSKKKTDLFEPEDYKAQFGDLDGEMKNSFRPLVAKNGGVNSLNSASVNTIPTSFTGGEQNWIYTGNMTVNTVPNALLENTVSGEGVFLKPGEKWKTMQLRQVMNDSIVLEGEDGYMKTIFFAPQTLEPVSPAKVATNLPPANAGMTTQPGQAPGMMGIPGFGNATNALTMPNMDQSGMNQGRGNRGGGGKGGGGKRGRGTQAESQTDLYGPIGSNLSDVYSSTDKNSTTSRKENQSQ